MPISIIGVLASILFILAYWVYGKRIGVFFKLNDTHKTPAVKMEDGCDFVPTNRSILLAQHFASIAAAGPIIGPIAAGLAFGWLPTLVWIVLGCIFIGACHDLSSLIASVRHGAKSIPEIAKQFLGSTGYKLCLIFIWFCLVYVIIAFTDVTARQFLAKEEWGGEIHNIGGGVATSSFLYLLLSVAMGLVTVKWKVPVWVATLFFFPLLIGIIFWGQKTPILLPFENPIMVWGILILAYCAIASVLPMWLLLQPRGYLGGYFLYTILIIGALGLFFGGFQVEYPAFKGFLSLKGESLYPFLFITVACGACSGFHGLVCSGTTSKQLKQETHAPLVGYGGMLLEGIVAVIALSTIMIWASDNPIFTKTPAEIYATGIAHFCHSIFGLDLHWGITFGMLAFATFVYDTLDVATRLSRYLIEELFGWKALSGRLTATAVTLGFPLVYVLISPSLEVGGKPLPLWQAIWPLFGSSNQLLAALTLCLMTLWAKSAKKWPLWLVIPALFMFLTSSIALLFQIHGAWLQMSQSFTLFSLCNLVVASLILFTAVAFAGSCFRASHK